METPNADFQRTVNAVKGIGESLDKLLSSTPDKVFTGEEERGLRDRGQVLLNHMSEWQKAHYSELVDTQEQVPISCTYSVTTDGKNKETTVTAGGYPENPGWLAIKSEGKLLHMDSSDNSREPLFSLSNGNGQRDIRITPEEVREIYTRDITGIPNPLDVAEENLGLLQSPRVKLISQVPMTRNISALE